MAPVDLVFTTSQANISNAPSQSAAIWSNGAVGCASTILRAATRPAVGRVVQSWDTANKTAELNDYSVCTTWEVHAKRPSYLVDGVRRRLNYPDLKRTIVEQRRSI